MRNSRRLVAALIGLGAMVPAASGADAATRIGATALEAHAQGAQDCFGSTLFVQEASVGVSYVVPGGGGVLTSWSAHGFGAPAQLVLKTVRKSAFDTYLVKGSSAVRTVAASGSSTFRTRIPVDAGDGIALWVPAVFPDKAPCNYVTGNAGDVMAYRGGSHPEPAVGEQVGPTSDHGSGFRLNVSAKLEPDADRDGFGDETQDGCPTDPAVQGTCPDRIAPKTTITRAPKPRITTKKRRVGVRFAFRASEASTFSCALDGETERCSSPFRAEVGRGRHHFRVVAIDGAGNRDATPARAEFVVRRKPRR